ncbi:hypothetical protein [Marinobacterium arenosum]|uniref:hypothetical protein n=1 Tax=Marinobacterium arenosum TaxID=2862496 RepID=UPI001C97E60F|nr:hypothetical protein [Marinobacterium arenosum]MBY4678557.1 hypothetical protein [Marinobacterium arenosum]
MHRPNRLSRSFCSLPLLSMLLLLGQPAQGADQSTPAPEPLPEPVLSAEDDQPVDEMPEEDEGVMADELEPNSEAEEIAEETTEELEPMDESPLESLTDESEGYPPLSDFNEMMERPLFSSNRRPAPAETTDTTASTSAQELKEQWQLTGVVLVGDNQMALFAERSGEKRLVLKIGMPLDDHWHLSEIKPHHVLMLNRDEEEARLDLREPRQPPKEAERKQRQRAKDENEAPNRAARTNQAATRAERASAQQAPKDNN